MNLSKQIYLTFLMLLATVTTFAVSPPTSIRGTCGTTVSSYTLDPSTDDMVWNDGNTYTITKTIIVPTGSTLQIRFGTVLKFVEGAEIIVQKGAFLYLRGMNTLLTSCNSGKFWKGIKIQGDPSLSQTTTNQGKIYFYRATISNAESAIRQDPNNSGGIIEAIEANFLNNQNGLHFQNYTSNKSISFVKECSFKIDEDFADLNYEVSVGTCNERKVGSQIKITSEDSIEILGCEFLNHYNYDHTNTAIYADPNTLGSAIYCVNSEVIIEPVNDVIEVPCDYPEGTRNSFYGWYHGVYVQYSVPGSGTVNIIGADFENNKYGVYIEKADSNTILDCTFEIDDSIRYVMDFEDCDGNDVDADFYGAYVKGKSTSVKIMSNTFEVDLIDNYGLHHGFFWDGPAGAFVPSNFEIKGNTFTFEVDNTVAGFAIPTYIAALIQDYKVAGTIKMKCNEFNIFSGLGASITEFVLYDLRLPNQTATITFQPSSASARNQWTDFGVSCYSSATTPVKVGFNIYTSDVVTYSKDGVIDNPKCNGGTVTLSTKSAGQACSTWDYCSEFEEEGPAGTNNIEELTISNDLNLYPNPAVEYIYIDGLESNSKATILGLDGRKVLDDITLKTGENIIDISSLSPGAYIIRVRSDKQSIQNTKFIKQ